ncbi:PTR3 [Candida pseudojiufengensis]|uniref:PTR3 n=1 Tax=Candida pseudojiufengensis TaxID=497109 RepID=UPI002224E2F6|nr:PTR3 [Candida pseudojiufengensis]KAI5960318.1 PTR3 [Candida pseudojiufengensis]
MDKSNLENLLRFPGYNKIINDASVLSCGCLTSESIFLNENLVKCPNCQQTNVSIISNIKPLRELYHILNDKRRRSSSRKSFKGIEESSSHYNINESMDLLTLFHKFAKEEQIEQSKSNVQPINIIDQKNQNQNQTQNQNQRETSITSSFPSSPSTNSASVSPQNYRNYATESLKHNSNVRFETLLENVSERKEYNFSKCFPFHRKLVTFQTQQMKLNLGPLKLGSSGIKKAISLSIHTYIDFQKGLEITRFVLVSEKRWELYEYVLPLKDTDISQIKPKLICSGKSSGEYGESSTNMNQLKIPGDNEILKRNDFGNKSEDKNSITELKKRLSTWDQMYSQLTKNFLVISGTKGVMRVFNIDNNSKYQMGEPLYTYLTDFPIRCLAISPNEKLIACAITAREKISDKEQPFIALHKIEIFEDFSIKSIEPIMITIPYRDPIKILNFNATSNHLICGTVWESRYVIIKLQNLEKPKLVYTDVPYKKDETVSDRRADDELMMTNEGITDLQFGNINTNTILVTSCYVYNRPALLFRLDGTQIDSTRSGIDDYSNKSFTSNDKDDENYSRIKTVELIMKIPEIGSSLHRAAISPRGDGIVYLDKDGRLFLVSATNFNSRSNSSNKKTIVQLGDVSNSERFTESAAVKFSADGSKIFTVDRKGVFQIFDFTKGIPGEDLDVVKCKIISL